jgi:hypothetical protein
MKADLPLEERRRIAAKNEREIRDALVCRHFAAIEDRRAIDAALVHHALDVGARALAVLNDKAPAGTVLTEVAAPKVLAPPAPSADNLRAALGLT